MLILKYENMKKDLPSTVAIIAKFIGQDISKKLVEEIAQHIIQPWKHEERQHSQLWMRNTHRNNLNPYLRKGEVGGWKDYFTCEQATWLDAIYQARLKEVGLDLNFSDQNDWSILWMSAEH